MKFYKVQWKTILDNRWESPDLNLVKPILLENHMGKIPDYLPDTQVKIVYDDNSVHINFCVKERFLRIEERFDQGRIWEDSCVEFFFSPFADISSGYFNIEMNAINSMLFNFQRGRNKDRIEIDKKDLEMIERYSSLPRNFVPDAFDEITWFAGYSIPIELLNKYSKDFIEPVKGVRWFGNFYKCGDKTKNPHWLTWNKVEKDTPDFHRPEDFGILDFI